LRSPRSACRRTPPAGTPPADPAPASPNSAYVGTYRTDCVGPATVSQGGSALVLSLGPQGQQFPLTHWDGPVFTTVPTGENAPAGSISAVTFEITGDLASAMTVEYDDKHGQGRFSR